MRLLFAILISVLSLFYFLPFAIAFNKKRANTGAIFALNLFLGWSLIGWVLALVWALKEEQVV
ncbi:superinfection immunity protein [Polynucleobacter sp. MWH-Creno-3A4]|uniref:superinfection immunity protein n=1 Tax=Polynucleobacter sp. MWH-Creno-3A4 TaxID=1855886 RepID=UPI001C0BDA5A|nr:superinfection immunity protein [Polynucleobacter sp. MWH-Creno-3A4]MBU3606743.1 superinfection immunity protein [Polynucleobacter sp. MWH-Creno-3A4]